MKLMPMVITAVMCASTVFAIDVAQLKGLPRGVQTVQFNPNGTIKSLVVVGKADVPVTLRNRPGKAAKFSGEKARNAAYIEFTRFLSTQCKWGTVSTNKSGTEDSATSNTGTNGVETATASSSFKEVEMTKEEQSLKAQACVSGIQAIWEGMNDMNEWVWVGGWDARALAAIPGIAQASNEIAAITTAKPELPKPPPPAQKPDPKPDPKPGSGNGNGGGFFNTNPNPQGTIAPQPANGAGGFFGK